MQDFNYTEEQLQQYSDLRALYCSKRRRKKAKAAGNENMNLCAVYKSSLDVLDVPPTNPYDVFPKLTQLYDRKHCYVARHPIYKKDVSISFHSFTLIKSWLLLLLCWEFSKEWGIKIYKQVVLTRSEHPVEIQRKSTIDSTFRLWTKDADKVATEIMLLRQSQHPNIIKFYEFYIWDSYAWVCQFTLFIVCDRLTYF
jgi:serine/threonine protein kinase